MMNKLEINDFSLAASAMVCNKEYHEFRKAFIFLASSVISLDAVQSGRWNKNDIESVVNADTMCCTDKELRQLRITNLEKDVKKAAELTVKKFNKLNRVYASITNNYICPYIDNRDALLKEKFIELAKIA